MRIEMMEYLEIDLYCLAIMMIILFRSKLGVEHRESWRMYQTSVFFMMGVAITDALWALFEGGYFSFTALPAHLINDLYFISATFCCSAWYFFTLLELEHYKTTSKIMRFLVIVSMCGLVLLLVVNWWTGCAFTFTPEGHFIRGQLMFVLYIIPNVYLVFAFFHPLFRVFQQKYYLKRSRYLYLALFPLVALCFAVAQFLIPGTPMPVMGMTLAFLLVYMNRQDLLVSLDPLTKLNNRGQFEYFLDKSMAHWNNKTGLYLFLLDLDYFKQINDTYGHIEGDIALQRMAQVLRQTADRFQCFVARYGGDEFAIIYETDDPAKVDVLCDFVRSTLKEANEAAGAKYRLTTSIGYAGYDGSTSYIPEFIAKADDALYAVKKARNPKRR